MLLAAAALAVALVPLAFAYLQLGYHGDVGAAALDDAPVREAERTLDRALQNGVDGIPANYTWSARTAAVAAVRDRLRPALATLNGSAVESGTAYSVGYNASRAVAWAGRRCPGGPDRQFGPCRADRGLVVQDRAGRTHVLAAAFDVRIATTDADWRATTVIRVDR